MASMKAIKRRLVSVTNTQQIMKAMNLVAASKLGKTKNKLENARPLIEGARRFLLETPALEGAEENAFFIDRPAKNTAYVVISGERGLCGGYNTNILKAAFAQMDGKNEQIIAVGAKCKDYLARRRKNITQEYVGVLEEIDYRLSQKIAENLCGDYADGKIDELYVAYTRFESILSHIPTVTKILPLVNGKIEGKREELIFEPDLQVYLRKSIPVYLTMFLYGAMMESAVCEQAARMTSMDSAAHNAGEIMDDLTLQYNRQRQSAITQEISEIVGGANAV